MNVRKLFNTSRKKRYVKPEIRKRKIQNNDPCPCGSGKKYKHCHKKYQN